MNYIDESYSLLDEYINDFFRDFNKTENINNKIKSNFFIKLF